jgi:hypothetical protein
MNAGLMFFTCGHGGDGHTIAVAPESICAVFVGPQQEDYCTIELTNGSRYLLQNDFACVVACIEGARSKAAA